MDGFKDASIVSTDFCYGFSQAVPGSRYNEKLEHLQRDVAKYVKKVDLVDMEVGQFYALCDLMSESTLEYIAVKGPANSLSHYEEGLGSTQENVIAPHLCVIYWAISAIIGGVFGYCLGSLLSTYYASVLMIFCALSGWTFVYIAELRTFRELYRKGSSGYRKYSELHRKLFGPWRYHV